MKTLAYKDLGDTRNILYHPRIDKYKKDLFDMNRHERNIDFLKEIKHVGNIAVYLIKGNKRRLLFVRGL